MTIKSFSSYDEPLGPRNGRYFGTGYQKVGQDMSELEIHRSTRPGAKHTAVARLSYPADWSTKKHRELVPHVSSVDTITLVATLCDAAISHTRDLSPAESARMWLRHASVRAGAAPHEDLGHIPLDAEVTTVADADEGEIETSFRFQVGNLTGTLTMVHPVGSGPLSLAGTDQVGHLTDVHGAGPHYYLDGIKNHTLTATHITVDEAATRITARHEVTVGSASGYVGAESAYWDSVSPVDTIVGTAQLSQILLYHLDGLDRTSSNTLWMRKLELFTDGPRRPASEPFDGTAEIRRTSVINRGGQRWRSADIALEEFGGLTGSCLLAHQLPD